MTAEPMLVGGRYQLGEVLGRGGMAEVRRAMDTRLGRPVAVKQLRVDLATDPTFQARFRREAQSAAGLNHPAIVSVYDTGEEPDQATGVMVPYIVMELVEGRTLRDILREERKILPERALELTAGVLEALSYSHKAGIVHRDIKPANVMLTPGGAVKVMDFGIARAVADTSATVTQTAAVIGTAQYLSPEQARGETVDARSDIYSAGCLLYELLVGRPPFLGDSPVSVAYQHVREAPVPPSAIDPSIGPEIDTVTLKALAKDADDRYPSAREMRADINRVLSGQQATALLAQPAEQEASATRVAAVPATAAAGAVAGAVAAEEIEEEPRRRRGLVVALVALLLVGLGAGAWALYRTLDGGAAPAVAQVTVPAVLNDTEQEARSKIEDRDLVPKVEETNGDADTEGEVVAQNPLGGQEVDPGTTVTITINAGPETGKIPDGLVGKDLDAVRRTLEGAGFTNVRADEAEEESAKADPNEVTAVEPGEGATVSLDDRVTVRYATGASEVPALTGSLESRAEATARAAGFKTRTERRESDEPEGIVIDQNPVAGERLERGSTITITVAEPKDEPKPEPPPPAPSRPEPSDPATEEPETPEPSEPAETPEPSEPPDDDATEPSATPSPSPRTTPTPSRGGRRAAERATENANERAEERAELRAEVRKERREEKKD